jgi:tripartite-type tricarboxylate transporter receptor subunit TctC
MAAIIAAFVALSAGTAGAQTADAFPSRPITIVVPYPPGGSNDVFARQVGKRAGRQR